MRLHEPEFLSQFGNDVRYIEVYEENGKIVKAVYSFDTSELIDDFGEHLLLEDYPFDDEHIYEKQVLN